MKNLEHLLGVENLSGTFIEVATQNSKLHK